MSKCPECDGHGDLVSRDWDGVHWRRDECRFCHGTCVDLNAPGEPDDEEAA